METLEKRFQAACDAGDIPGAVLLAKNKSGQLNYAHAVGTRSLKDPSACPPLTLDTVIRIASCTKLVTSIAVMQCVERGLLHLDSDAMEILPDLKGLKLLKAFQQDGKPVLATLSEPLTLRRLLSHSSGFCYDSMSPMLVKWRALRGEECQPGGKRIEDRFFYPLVYEPGSSWTYGPSIEWSGKMVEKVNGGISLEEYMQRNIWEPLGIKDMTFFLQNRPDLLARRADTSIRDPDGSGKVTYVDDRFWHEDNEDCFGGMALFTSPAEFMKIMHSLLMNDGKLLDPDSVDLLFQPQLSEQSRNALNKFYEDPVANDMMGTLMPLGLKKDHALGGMLLTEDIPDAKWRRKGTMTWSGMPNVFWAIDREAGLCTMYGSQVRPAGDKKSIELATLFERTMYERL